jgi:hypothetical protein
MKLHLDHTPAQPGFEIGHASTLFLIGSCFSENIGARLQEHKFNTFSNPSGILFNPLSIHQSLSACLEQETIPEKYLLERGGTALSFLHHSSVNKPTAKELTAAIQEGNKTAHTFLKAADYLIITFGSAYYYHHKQLDTAVANCHKQPGHLFEKRLINTSEIISLYSALLEDLPAFNPKLKVVFTVSPVKYLRDGLVENNISKSTLLLSVHELTKRFSHCFYFPAYELVNDDLRDYRFYKPDMAHPSEQAIDYVWQKFSGCFFSEKTIDLNQRIAKLNAALNHRELHTNAAEAMKLKEFISRQKAEIAALAPELKF